MMKPKDEEEPGVERRGLERILPTAECQVQRPWRGKGRAHLKQKISWWGWTAQSGLREAAKPGREDHAGACKSLGAVLSETRILQG